MKKNFGYVGGVNHGLKKGMENNADYFMIMNNDTIMIKMQLVIWLMQQYVMIIKQLFPERCIITISRMYCNILVLFSKIKGI